jgi:hypothetical protein
VSSRDREFESGSLQRGVSCEPNFWGASPGRSRRETGAKGPESSSISNTAVQRQLIFTGGFSRD